MVPRTFRAAVLLLPVLCLTACSGTPGHGVTVTVTATAAPGAAAASDPAAPGTGLAAACPLLPKAEAQLIVDATLLDGMEGDPSSPSCTYNTSPTGPKTAQVLVTARDAAKNTYDVDRSLQHAFTDVAGVGDEAHLEEFAIYFRKGATWAGVSVDTPDDTSRLPALLTDAGKAIAARLP